MDSGRQAYHREYRLKQRGRLDREFLKGLGIVTLLAVMVAAGFWPHSPEPHTSGLDPRAFHCDEQTRLPCNGVRP